MKDIIKSIVAGATESVVVKESSGFNIEWSKESAKYTYAGSNPISLEKEDPIAAEVELVGDGEVEAVYAVLGGTDDESELYLEVGTTSTDGSAKGIGFTGTPNRGNWNAYKALATIVLDQVSQLTNGDFEDIVAKVANIVESEVRAAGLKVKMVRSQ